MKVAIIKYNAGNTQSVIFALERLGVRPVVTDEPDEIESADKVIFPGVGEAGTAMRSLKKSGLDRLLPRLRQPVLGICLGLQLMCRHSEEADTPGLGIFSESVRRFPPKEKVPHMGWNLLTDRTGPLFSGMEGELFSYFVHSYYVERSERSAAVSHYMLPFSSALARDNFFGVQFHPEKSGPQGEKILQNFLLV